MQEATVLVSLLTALFLSYPAQADDVVISKAKFMEAMKSGLPGKFCEDKTYFRTCFPLSKDDCAKEAAKAVSACADKMQSDIPDKLHQPVDGQKWGQQLGTCAGTAFEQDEAAVKAKSADCADQTKWNKQ